MNKRKSRGACYIESLRGLNPGFPSCVEMKTQTDGETDSMDGIKTSSQQVTVCTSLRSYRIPRISNIADGEVALNFAANETYRFGRLFPG